MTTMPALPKTVLAARTGATLALVGGLVAFVVGVSAVCASVLLPLTSHPRIGVVRAQADHAEPAPVGAGRDAAAAIETDNRRTIPMDRHAADPRAANRRPGSLALDGHRPPYPPVVRGAAGQRRGETTLPSHVIELERSMRVDIAAEWALGVDLDMRRELAAMAAAAHNRTWGPVATWSVEHNRGRDESGPGQR